MNPSGTIHPPAITAAQQCRRYQDVGLPTTFDERERVWMHTGDDVGAISMPGALGKLVQRELIEGGTIAPIINWPRCFRWVYLTEPSRDALPRETSAALFRVFTQVHSRGAMIAMPAPANDEVFHREWIIAPDGCGWPGMQTVLNATVLIARRYQP